MYPVPNMLIIHCSVSVCCSAVHRGSSLRLVTWLFNEEMASFYLLLNYVNPLRHVDEYCSHIVLICLRIFECIISVNSENEC